MARQWRAKCWTTNFDSKLDIRLSDRRVTPGNAASCIEGATLVLDGCDNFATRLAVSDACVASAIPLVSAAVGRFQGQVANFAGHLPGQSCYRCYVGDAFDADDCDTCADDGMLGAMAGWAGHFRRAAGDPRAAARRQHIRRSAMGQAASARRAEAGHAHDFHRERPGVPRLRPAIGPRCSR